MTNEIKIHKVESLKCQQCHELLLKVFPYGMIVADVPMNQIKVVCIKCELKARKGK